MKKLLVVLFVLLSPIGIWADDTQKITDTQTAPVKEQSATNSWQEALSIHAPGLSNAYQLSPMLYRGAQPTEEGYKSLADMGIKAVISFRTKEPNTELLKELGLVSYHIPINTFRFNNDHAREFLKILSEQ